MYFRFNELAQKHTRLGAEYGNVRRRIEELIGSILANNFDVKSLETVRSKLDQLALEEPVVPSWVFQRTLKQLQTKAEPEPIRAIREQMAQSAKATH